MVRRVASITNWGQNGLADWLIQRISAVIIGLYVLCLLGYFLACGPVSYLAWHSFMHSLPMQVFTLLMLIAVAAHAWIGLWTITTDYIKPFCWRLLTQIILGLITAIYFLWAILVLWGA